MLHNVTIYSIHGSYGFCFLLRASFRGRVKLCQAGGALSHREIYAARPQRVVGMQRDSFITMVTNPHELGYNYGYLSTYTIHIYISGTAFPSSKIQMIPAMIPAVYCTLQYGKCSKKSTSVLLCLDFGWRPCSWYFVGGSLPSGCEQM